jgi:hypothetical protein
LRVSKLTFLVVAALALAITSTAWAAGGGAAPTPPPTSSGTSDAQSGGAGVAPVPAGPSTPSHPLVTGFKAKIIRGLAYAPSYAPLAVKQAIWAGDQIRTKPYIAVHYASLASAWPGYDCSGSVSYVLYKAGLMSAEPDVSGDFETYGQRGKGQWITVWGSAGHTFIEVAGIVFDTAHYAAVMPAGTGPRWQPASIVREQLHDGNVWSERHPIGF